MASAAKAFDELLINAIQQYPCLYNSKLKQFKDNRIKKNAWRSGGRAIIGGVCRGAWGLSPPNADAPTIFFLLTCAKMCF